MGLSELPFEGAEALFAGVINSNANSSKRKTPLMKTLLFVPADGAAIIRPSQKETLRVRDQSVADAQRKSDRQK
jgi:hypothetical protein